MKKKKVKKFIVSSIKEKKKSRKEKQLKESHN